MHKPKLSITFFICTIHTSIVCFGQFNTNLDSLLSKIDVNNASIENINNLIHVADQLSKVGKIDESLSYAIKARGLAEKINFKEGKAYALLTTGRSYLKKGAHQASNADLSEAEKILNELNDLSGLGRVHIAFGELCESLAEYKKGFEYHAKALEYFKKGRIIEGEIIANNGLGISCYRVGNYELAVLYHLKALELIDSVRSVNHQSTYYGFTVFGTAASALNNLGVVYERLEDYESALVYYLKCLDLLKDEKLMRFVSKSLSNIAGIYNRLNRYGEAKKFLDEAMNVCISIEEEHPVYLYSNYGDYYKGIRKYDSAEYFYERSVKASKEINHAEGRLIASLGLSDLYLKLHNIKKAEEFTETAVQLAKEINSKPSLVDVFLSKSKIDSAKGNYQQSLAWLKMHYELKDSLFRHTKVEQISYLQSYLNTESSKLQSTNSASTNFTTLSSPHQPTYQLKIIILSLLLLMLFSFLYRNRLLARK
jgi:tetratricopeptide (TPR) repeat protein